MKYYEEKDGVGIDTVTLLTITNSNHYMKLDKLAGMIPAYIGGCLGKKTFYLLGHCFVSYLIEEYGIDKWVELWKELKDHEYNISLKKTYGKRLAQFQPEFDDFIERTLRNKYKNDRRVEVAIHLFKKN